MSIDPLLSTPPLPTADDRWALFLDVDGTLIEFAERPDEVIVAPQLTPLLHELYDALGGALALVSGRSVGDLDRLFGAPRWAKAGLHGLELQRPDGSQRLIQLDADAQARLHRQAAAVAATLPGVRMEDKGMAVALHSRSAPDQWETLVKATDVLIGGLPEFELQRGNQVVEIKPHGMDKGIAVAELMSLAPFYGRTPVYIGDDLTDEHAFASVNLENGLSVLVGDRQPSLAQFTLSTPSQVHAWLARVRDALKEGAAPHANRTGGLRTARES